METAQASVVDVVFPLHGAALPRDHRLALARALASVQPWLAQEPLAAVHPINIVHGGGSAATGDATRALLSARARLVVRAPRERVDALAGLSGQSLQVGDCELRLGEPKPRELLPHATLYAHFVASEDADEAAFLDTINEALRALDARCHSVCGKALQVRAAEGTLGGYSLMLHGLSAAASLRVLEHGLGTHRLMGCGVFVPHKSAAAVGD